MHTCCAIVVHASRETVNGCVSETQSISAGVATGCTDVAISADAAVTATQAYSAASGQALDTVSQRVYLSFIFLSTEDCVILLACECTF